jgi:LysM repeat protein
MIRKTVLMLSITLFTTLGIFAQPTQQDFERYIEKYKELAIREMQRAGVPASIKLGQALLESDAGRSDLARRANNHFGIKCNNDWDGKTYHKKDDDYNDQGEHIESCFRVYEDAEASYYAHSEFLRNPKKQFRYGPLFALDPTDYKGWAEGLRKAGYATSPVYSKMLVDVIEKYRLYKYDYMTLANPLDEPIASNNNNAALGAYLVTNDVKYVLAREREAVEAIAQRTATSVRSLALYNENIQADTQTLEENTKVYLQPKRSSYRGKESHHTVRQGETMFEIAQEYALKLDNLYERNRMNPGMEPAFQEKIKLKGGRVSQRPKLASEVPQLELPIILPKPPVKDTVAIAKPTATPVKPAKEETVTQVQEPTLPEITPIQNPSIASTETKPTPQPPVIAEKPEGSKPLKSGTNEDFDEDRFASKPKPSVPVANPVAQYHTVAKGDTLWNISQRYSLPVDNLKKLNNLNSDSINLGMKLRVQ